MIRRIAQPGASSVTETKHLHLQCVSNSKVGDYDSTRAPLFLNVSSCPSYRGGKREDNVQGNSASIFNLW
jgi:hypothetical protein